MREELVRTDEENVRHKQLVSNNRRRRELLRQKQKERQLSMPQVSVASQSSPGVRAQCCLQCLTNDSGLLRESDWRHLSNVVSAYETHCLKTYLQQRSAVFLSGRSSDNEHLSLQHHTTLPMNLTMSLFAFLGALPAARSLSFMNQTYLSKHNLRSLLFPNMFELSQLCFTEPWQVKPGVPVYETLSFLLDLPGAIDMEMDLWAGAVRDSSVHHPASRTLTDNRSDHYASLDGRSLLLLVTVLPAR